MCPVCSALRCGSAGAGQLSHSFPSALSNSPAVRSMSSRSLYLDFVALLVFTTIFDSCSLQGWHRAVSEQIKPLIGCLEATQSFPLTSYRSFKGLIPFYPFSGSN